MHHLCLGFVVLYHVARYRLVEHIDISLLELPRADTALKQEVQLCKSAACGLGKSEVGVDDAKETNASPEETIIDVSVWLDIVNGIVAYPV